MRILTLLVSAALVTGLGVALHSGAMPLGVTGEWEWLRLPVRPSAIDLLLAAGGVGAYSVTTGVGMAVLRARATTAREVVAVTSLLLASVAVQATVQTGAPVGYGLEK